MMEDQIDGGQEWWEDGIESVFEPYPLKISRL